MVIGTFGIGHHGGDIIVFLQIHSQNLKEAELSQYSPKELGDLGCTNNGHKLTLSGANTNCGYPFRTVCDDNDTKTEQRGAN
jgi:hypothetical protein